MYYFNKEGNNIGKHTEKLNLPKLHSRPVVFVKANTIAMVFLLLSIKDNIGNHMEFKFLKKCKRCLQTTVGYNVLK